jgi:hypothetical protein
MTQSLAGRRRRLNGAGIDLAVLLGVLVVLLVFRWGTLIAVGPFNPDEAQITSNALRILRHGVGWLSSDGSTSGPLNSVPLVLPALFGVEPSLFSSRVIAAVLLAISITTVYLIAHLWLPRLMALVVIAPAVAAEALTTASDMVHYSSELLPIALTVLAVYLMLRLFRGSVGRVALLQLILVGLIAGALPFTKIQTAPIAMLLAVAGAGYIVLLARERWRLLVPVLVVAGVLPGAFLLAPLVVTGNLDNFTIGYLGLARAYVSTPLDVFQVIGLALADPWMAKLMVWAVIATLLVAAVAATGNLPALDRSARLSAGLVGLFVIVTYVAIVFPGRMFPHYLQFAWAPMLIVIAALLARVPRWARRPRTALVASGTVLMIVFAAIAQPLVAIEEARVSFYTFRTFASSVDPQRGDLFDPFTDGHPTESLVWGWMPQWYLATGTYPATHETMNEFQIRDTPNRDFFRDRLIDDLEAAEPGIIVDGVFLKAFAFRFNAKDGIQSFPELAEFVEAGYQQVSSGVASCPTTYLSDELLSDYERRWVVPDTVEELRPGAKPEDPAALFDRQLFQADCRDSWSPSAHSGTVDASFRPETLAAVWVLGYRSDTGPLPLSTATISLLSNGDVADTVSSEVAPWPHWTRIAVDGAEVDSVRITVDAPEGGAARLNEVMLLRD